MKFKHRLFRLCLIFFGLYLILFAGRLVYGYHAYPDGGDAADRAAYAPFSTPEFLGKRNYAGSTYAVAGQHRAVDQKYEKIAEMRLASDAFEADEKKIRGTVAEYTGIIQSEQGQGTQGKRVLHLTVGVHPDKFDAFCDVLKTVGTLRSMEVSKQDKTNEFLDLKAQRASLEKTRAALMELRTQGGGIEELMQLQNRILEIEQQLQTLGVQLGDFDEVNAFCTVRVSLAEYVSEAGPGISVQHRLRVALVWAAEVYAGLVGLALLTAAAAFFVLLALDRFNILRRLVSTLESTGGK